MKPLRVLVGTGVVFVLVGLFVIGYSVVNPICTGLGACGPNYPLTAIGLAVSLVGIAIGLGVRRRS
ncbi:hypothetical protein [Halorussus lipolyticus]|uniref:hypothetical protein n=1 Tax=Halorussus lipolyticus TaxID=3034024 RepID=UPI0023E7FE4D|nr:hypothetical protein [Halorussus sp. DT80]